MTLQTVEPSAALSPAASAPPPKDYRVVAVIIACALFMQNIDATVLATALPTMARDLGVPVTEVSSSLTSYLLALAIFIPASGWLADRLGSKAVFTAAILVFLAGSTLCGLAHNLPFLVAARFLQGMGGAMMVPVGRLILLRSVSKADRLQAMAWLIIPGLVGPVIGPPLGGLIVTYLDWRWIFYLNLPIGLIEALMVVRIFTEVRPDSPAPLDWRGFALSAVSLSCLLFGFESASRFRHLDQTVWLILAGLAAGTLYVLHARKHAKPIVDLSLLKIPTFRLSVIAGALTRITQGAQPLLLPLLFQVSFGMTAAESGGVTFSVAAGALAMKWISRPMLRRFGFRRALIVNGILAACGWGACAFFRSSWPIPLMFAILAASGFFMSFQFTAYNAIAYDQIPPPRMSAATSFYSTCSQLSLSMGVCIASASLHLGMLTTHRSTPSPDHFTMAFLVVAAISASATICNLKFAKDVGHELTARRPRSPGAA